VLTSLGFGCKWEPPDHYQVRAPYWRTDIHIPDDVAEEVARIIGYDTIPTRGLTGEVPPLLSQPRRELRERVKRALAAAGMQEVITYSLTTIEALQRVVPPEELAIYQPLRAISPLSSQHEYARTTLRASVLEALAANARLVEGELAIFEAGRVYLPQDGDQPLEQEHVVGAVAGRHVDRWGRPAQEPVDFYDAKGYLDTLFDQLGVAVVYTEAPSFALLPGRSAELQAGRRRVGTIGQLHPAVAAEFDIDEDVYLFELLLDDLLPAVGGTRTYRTFSRFPAVARDLALLVDRTTPAERVRELIEEHKLVQAARLFDVYEGDRVPAGKKSLAFSVLYQSPDHTLTDDDVAAAQRSLLERLRRELGAELRGG
jgi:phenylalanyl-tRNA synthetase beta chain